MSTAKEKLRIADSRLFNKLGEAGFLYIPATDIGLTPQIFNKDETGINRFRTYFTSSRSDYGNYYTFTIVCRTAHYHPFGQQYYTPEELLAWVEGLSDILSKISVTERKRKSYERMFFYKALLPVCISAARYEKNNPNDENNDLTELQITNILHNSAIVNGFGSLTSPFEPDKEYGHNWQLEVKSLNINEEFKETNKTKPMKRARELAEHENVMIKLI